MDNKKQGYMSQAIEAYLRGDINEHNRILANGMDRVGRDVWGVVEAYEKTDMPMVMSAVALLVESAKKS